MVSIKMELIFLEERLPGCKNKMHGHHLEMHAEEFKICPNRIIELVRTVSNM
jgi:hypothetical protein